MRRNEIVSATNAILDALKISGLGDYLMEIRRRGESAGDPAILEHLKPFAILSSQFSSAAQSVLQIVGLDLLEEASTWGQLIQKDNPLVWQLASRVNFAREYLPKIIKLLEQKGKEEFIRVAGKNTRFSSGVETISVILLEKDSEFSRPQRLIEVLEAIDLLYEHCARLLGEPSGKLTVLSCDSGSDKSFDLLGAAKVIEQIKELILGLWDKVVFFKERRFSAQMEVISDGLNTFHKITELESTGNLGPEEAEIIRRGLMRGCQKFLDSGAIIPEIGEHTRHDPRVLMAPEQKLLMAPIQDSKVTDDSIPQDPIVEQVTNPSDTESLMARLSLLEAKLSSHATPSTIEPSSTTQRTRKRVERKSDS